MFEQYFKNYKNNVTLHFHFDYKKIAKKAKKWIKLF